MNIYSDDIHRIVHQQRAREMQADAAEQSQSRKLRLRRKDRRRIRFGVAVPASSKPRAA